MKARKVSACILDFGASLEFTHHARTIQAVSYLLEKVELDHVICLPKGSEVNSLARVRKNILPSSHTVAFSVAKKSSWISGTLGLFYRLQMGGLCTNVFRKVIGNMVLMSGYRSIKLSLKPNDSAIIVFPTACPIALQLGRKLEKKGFKCLLIFRLTNTSENRGFYKTNESSFKKLLKALESQKVAKCKFISETQEYRELMSDVLYSIEYAPLPPLCESRKSTSKPGVASIGFLGRVQSHKGVNLIEAMVEESLKTSYETRWVIQRNSISMPMNRRVSTSSSIHFVSDPLPESEFAQLLSKIDIMCLPYDVMKYQKNASALAYRSFDNSIPVITFKGSAFGAEISRFGIGIEIETVQDCSGAIQRILDDWSLYQENILAYNRFRMKQNTRLILN